MTEELQTFDFVAGNKFDLLRWVNGRVDAAIKSTEDGREFECKCALEMSVVPAVGGAGDCALVSSFIETGKTGGGILEQKSNAFASAAIAAAESCDKDDAILNAIATDRSQNPRKPETIFRLAARLPVFGMFESGEAKIDVKKLLALLQLDDADRASARSKLTSDRQQFDDEAAAIEADLINLQKEHDASVTKSKSGPGLLASLLYEKYWPYILISALGLKIARVRYI